MKTKPLSLIEVLQPRPYSNTPERARVTRTIVQPEIDAFEQTEAATMQAKSALSGRHLHEAATRLSAA